MAGTLKYLGLASPDGSGATSSHGLGSVVRSGLAGTAVGIAVVAVAAFGAAPALADHNPGHDVVAGAQADTLQSRVDELEAGQADLQGQIDTIELTPGPKGDKGDKGDQGEIGQTGDQGDQGEIGQTGAKGDEGDKGDKGDKGDTGEQGIQGVKGDTGGQGLPGIQGVQGETGEQGEPGTAADVTSIQAQLDNLALLASRRASAFIFVTRATYDGNLGGIAGASDICNDTAALAGLPGEYKAWLASSLSDDPATTFFRAPGPYILPNGVKVADDWADLTDGSLQAPINVDEDGIKITANSVAWTSVRASGVFGSISVVTAPRHCSGWTSNVDGTSNSNIGWTGATDSTSGRWTDRDIAILCSVATHVHLYCVGQGLVFP